MKTRHITIGRAYIQVNAGDQSRGLWYLTPKAERFAREILRDEFDVYFEISRGGRAYLRDGRLVRR